MNWRVKPFAQKLLGILPDTYSERLNHYFSHRFGTFGKVHLSNRWVLKMIELISSQGYSPNGMQVLEIGTGWSCLSALTLAQFGTKHIDTIDIHRHVRMENVMSAVEYLVKNWDLLKVQGAPRGLNMATSWEDNLSNAGITYTAPMDTTIIAGSEKFDFIFSESVMSHIPEKQLQKIIEATMRLLKPGGLAYHLVTTCDNMAWLAGDGKISHYHYLQYGRFWYDVFYNPRISHQNRLRCSQFVELYKNSGFNVLNLERIIPNDTKHCLDEIKIAPEFHRFDRQDLETTAFNILLQKTASM
jgi:2-polyprenyl-3-methyl-5-hydroxy-6-metoxy-1,4-benzoquinol methylase